MPKYSGHKNWAHWNVSLWIHNDESLYNLARGYARRSNRAVAAQSMLDDLHAIGITKTPDGAAYSLSSIRAAMVGITS